MKYTTLVSALKARVRSKRRDPDLDRQIETLWEQLNKRLREGNGNQSAN